MALVILLTGTSACSLVEKWLHSLGLHISYPLSWAAEGPWPEIPLRFSGWGGGCPCLLCGCFIGEPHLHRDPLRAWAVSWKDKGISLGSQWYPEMINCKIHPLSPLVVHPISPSLILHLYNLIQISLADQWWNYPRKLLQGSIAHNSKVMYARLSVWSQQPGKNKLKLVMCGVLVLFGLITAVAGGRVLTAEIHANDGKRTYLCMEILGYSRIDMKIYDMIWYDMILYWYDMTWFDMIWYEMIWYYNILYDLIWCDTILIWHDLIWYDMIWYDIWLWYDITMIDMVWNMQVCIPV